MGTSLSVKREGTGMWQRLIDRIADLAVQKITARHTFDDRCPLCLNHRVTTVLSTDSPRAETVMYPPGPVGPASTDIYSHDVSQHFAGDSHFSWSDGAA